METVYYGNETFALVCIFTDFLGKNYALHVWVGVVSNPACATLAFCLFLARFVGAFAV